MIKEIRILALIIIFLMVSFQSSTIAQSRTELPNDFGIELLGKAALYSFSYQHMFGNHFGLEAGLSALGGGSSGDNTLIFFVPLGARLYIAPKNGSPFATGGFVVLTGSTDSGPLDKTETYGYAGFGFEFRSMGGFVFRGTAYGLIIDEGFFIWPGLYVGYAF